MVRFRILLLFVLLAGNAAAASTAVLDTFTLAPPFESGMVLQRGMRVPVFGSAEDGTLVTVTFAGQLKAGTAAGGRWRIDLDPLLANGTGQTCSVFYSHAATQTQKTTALTDVVVGEVWFASGQSNMELKLSTVLGISDTADVPGGNLPNIRFFQVAKDYQPDSPPTGTWSNMSASNVGPFSALCFYFGRELQPRINVPLGIIGAYAGGTRIEAWMPPATYDEEPAYEYIRQAYQDRTSLHPGPNSIYNIPGLLHQAMVEPLIPYAIRGMLWYQGESNSGQGYFYTRLQNSLIRGWRAQWGQGDFPFILVQLPKYSAPFQEFRDAQWASTREMANTHMVVTIDTGDVNDIHPRDKEPIGIRLALMARAKVHGESIVYGGPMALTKQIEGNQMKVGFEGLGTGLKDLGAGLPGFEIAGANNVFYPATAVISGSQVSVSSPQVPAPTAVRYAWSAAPALSLGNQQNFPAGPFSTLTASMFDVPVGVSTFLIE